MKFTKFDIGAEIIAILTRGMYPDPKDALREYIQNGVDAKASHIDVRIRQNNIVIQDNGFGMNHATLRKAARIGVSDKNPSRDVGFMGIGIYSAYHLCDSLTIISKMADSSPNRLVMNFAEMKRVLKDQRELRLKGEIDSDQAIDLQTLMEGCVEISEEGSLNDDVFPNVGTRIEMTNISAYFYTEISDFDRTSNYLKEVVPLKFNTSVFSCAANIDEQIRLACVQNNSNYESIGLTLQVNSTKQALFKPYTDADFHGSNPQNEHIIDIKDSDGVFYGVMWGCLNSERKKIRNSKLRGFLIKKQGFAIGQRSNVVKYFSRGNTFFDRFIGEIIITNPLLLPNASRNDIEYSPLRERFFESLVEGANEFDSIGQKYQEDCKADEVLDRGIESVKAIHSKVNMNLQISDELLRLYTELNKEGRVISDRIKTKRIRDSRMSEAEELEKDINELLSFIQDRLTINNNKKRQTATVKPQSDNKATSAAIGKRLNKLKNSGAFKEDEKYESLLLLLDDLELKYDDNLRILLEMIDEQFVQARANSKEDYYKSLTELRREYLNEDE